VGRLSQLFSFVTAVSSSDCEAPPVGERRLGEHLRLVARADLAAAA
jgi:hypothetical protein